MDYDEGDDLELIRRQKGDGTYTTEGEQWAPSVHQQHLARLRSELTTDEGDAP